jgi:hypothetical protein
VAATAAAAVSPSSVMACPFRDAGATRGQFGVAASARGDAQPDSSSPARGTPLRPRQVDPVTRVLSIALVTIKGADDKHVEPIVQTISFVLVGILIATSIRGFLQIWLKIFHLQNATYSIHYSNMLVLFMAWMMGMYFVSSVLLMRMNLPLMYRKAITQVLSPASSHMSRTVHLLPCARQDACLTL